MHLRDEIFSIYVHNSRLYAGFSTPEKNLFHTEWLSFNGEGFDVVRDRAKRMLTNFKSNSNAIETMSTTLKELIKNSPQQVFLKLNDDILQFLPKDTPDSNDLKKILRLLARL